MEIALEATKTTTQLESAAAAQLEATETPARLEAAAGAAAQ